MFKRPRPLILAYNLWGKLAFNVHSKLLIQSPAIRSLADQRTLYICPVINFSKSDISTRAQRFTTKVTAILKNVKDEKIDIVAFSMAGLDVKVALHENKHLADRVKNYVTVGTPQHGTLLSVLYANNQLDSSQLEKSNLCTGVHYHDLMETNEENMNKLNDYLEPNSQIAYHYIAGDKAFQDQTDVFKRVSKRLMESSINNESLFNDGLFFDDEVINGDKSLKLNADHLDLSPVGTNRGQDAYEHIFRYLNSY